MSSQGGLHRRCLSCSIWNSHERPVSPSRSVGFAHTTSAVLSLAEAVSLEIWKEKTGPGIDEQISDRVEHAVSRIVGDAQGLVVDDLDESWVASTVRGVETPRGMGGGDEECVRAFDEFPLGAL